MIKLINAKQFSCLPNAVLIDLDNTIYAYQPAHEKGQNAVREKSILSLGIKHQEFDQAFAMAREQIKESIKPTASSHSRLLYFQRTFEILGLGSQILLTLDFEQTYWRNFLKGTILFEGVREFFDELRILDIPFVIISDLTAQIQFRKLIYFGLEDIIDHVVTSEEIGSDKPNAKVFKKALEKLSPIGKVVWMIGDDAERDIRGAKESIGAITIQKIHGDIIPCVNGEADATFDEFTDLHSFLIKFTEPA